MACSIRLHQRHQFVQAGREAAGIEGINPGEVFLQGIGLAGSMSAGLMRWKLLYQPAALFAGLFAVFILFFAFCAISCQLALTLMESYIMTGGGVGGAIRGLGAATGSLAREARNAAVPTLGRAVTNLQELRLKLERGKQSRTRPSSIYVSLARKP